MESLRFLVRVHRQSLAISLLRHPLSRTSRHLCSNVGTTPSRPGSHSTNGQEPTQSDQSATPIPSSQAKNAESQSRSQSKSSSDLREAMYQAILKRIPEHGWTSLAVNAALRDLDLSLGSAGLLPSGIACIAGDFEARCNRDLASHLVSFREFRRSDGGDNDDRKRKSEQMSLPHDDTPPARAAYAIQYRLSLLDPYHTTWYQAIALRPRIARKSLRNRLLLADEIAAYASYNSPNVRL